MNGPTVPWSPRREDAWPAALIVGLPLLVALPQLGGLVLADPIHYTPAVSAAYQPGFLRGSPYIDPNSGFTTQALGVRAALEWLQGNVPWWNSYSGVGLPLAAEYQPAAFFPLTFLLLLPLGLMWLQLSLQVLSGLGTYGLLRQIGCRRFAAITGALLFTFNGTLAWFAHGPAGAVPFLPWLLWGIERVHATAGGRWRLMAAAMAMSLLAGFPETAYINGLLALAWSIVRGLQLPRSQWRGYASGISLGGVVGIALAAPQVYAFFHYLPHAYLGGHAGAFAKFALPPESVIPSLLAPYAFGPIFGYATQWPALGNVWGSIGGYTTLLLLVAAVYGFGVRRDPLGWLLLGWCVAVLAKTFGIEPGQSAMNLVPGVAEAAFARYVQPTWQLAMVILAARGLDALEVTRQPDRAARMAAAVVACAAIAGGLWLGSRHWADLQPHVGLRNSALFAILWALGTTIACLVLIRRGEARGARAALAALLVAESMLMTFIPTLSNPRVSVLDRSSIEFLRANLGLQRFYTLGPLQPNYGAYFGIAQLNHNYLPVARRWVDWMRARLDAHGDAVTWVGNNARAPGEASQAEELRRNLAGYQEAGVKFVVSFPGDEPLAGVPGVRRAHSGPSMAIHELPSPRPYFEGLAGHCSVEPRGREAAVALCARPGRVVRRELFFPGWRASANAAPVEIDEHDRVFQAIDLPAGRHELRFRYSPPGVGWAWLALLAGLLVFVSAPWMRRRAAA